MAHPREICDKLLLRICLYDVLNNPNFVLDVERTKLFHTAVTVGVYCGLILSTISGNSIFVILRFYWIRSGSWWDKWISRMALLIRILSIVCGNDRQGICLIVNRIKEFKPEIQAQNSHFVPKMKFPFFGKIFQSIQEIKENATRESQAVPSSPVHFAGSWRTKSNVGTCVFLYMDHIVKQIKWIPQKLYSISLSRTFSFHEWLNKRKHMSFQF